MNAEQGPRRTSAAHIAPSSAVAARFVHEQRADFEQQLDSLRASLDETLRKCGVANAELQFTEKRVTAAAEELRSMDQELRANAEELQATREILRAPLVKLPAKLDEFNGVDLDLDPQSNAAGHPRVFLDAQLRLLRVTPEASALFRFRSTDVGRLITDFNHHLDYPDLAADLQLVADSETPRRCEVCDNSGRSWLLTMVPIMPRVLGTVRVIMTCVDVSRRLGQPQLQEVVDAMAGQVAVLDSYGVIQLVNRHWRSFAKSQGDPGLCAGQPGENYPELCRHAALRTDYAGRIVLQLRAILNGRHQAFTYAYTAQVLDAQRRFLMLAAPMVSGNCLVTHVDISDWTDLASMDARLAEHQSSAASNCRKLEKN